MVCPWEFYSICYSIESIGVGCRLCLDGTIDFIRFINFIDHMGFIDLPLSGRNFTWF